MKEPQHNETIDFLEEAYEKMYKRTSENFHKATEKSRSLLHKFVDEAEEKASELGEISKEDARKIAAWLKRDLNDAVEYLIDTEYELKDWLGFETRLLKSTMLDLMLKTADKTSLELLKLNENFTKENTYTTGEITGPGTLLCDQCDEVLHFHKTGKIPPCPKCHATKFHRKIK